VERERNMRNLEKRRQQKGGANSREKRGDLAKFHPHCARGTGRAVEEKPSKEPFGGKKTGDPL